MPQYSSFEKVADPTYTPPHYSEMTKMLLILGTILLTVTWSNGSGHGWSYSGENGPESWGHAYKLCAGKKQSPIDLKSDSSRKPLSNVILKKYGTISKKNTDVKNNGHSVQMSMTKPSAATMSGGPLPATYEFLQLHFHWGSEHTVDGKRFPLEMHMVHKKKGEKNPTDVKDGLAVASFLFEISTGDNPLMNALVSTFPNIVNPGQTTSLKQTLSVFQLISPALPGGYFSYSGSLTTPTCNEVVQWIVYKTPLKISQSQIKAFESLKSGPNTPLKDNFRPVQPLNGRIVTQTA